MVRAKIKITPLGRRTRCNRQRSGGQKKSKSQDEIERNQNAENCPPNLDYNVIEEIANGVEKMILSWSHLEEREQENDKSVYEDEKLDLEREFASTMWILPVGKEVSPDNIGLPNTEMPEEICDVTHDSCVIPFPKDLLEHPGETAVTADIPGCITAEMSLDGNCPGSGIGHAISKIVTEEVKHSGAMMMSDTRTEKTLEKTATCWHFEASNVLSDKCMSVCTEEETTGLNTTLAGNTDSESASQNASFEGSIQPQKCARKHIPTSAQPSVNHSSPRTPPIRERSAKRMQSQEGSSKQKLQLSMSKKTRWSEKVYPKLPPVVPEEALQATISQCNSDCYSEDGDCTKSSRSDCSLLDITSDCSWNDLSISSPCQHPSPLRMDGHQAEEFGPWDNVSGRRHPVIIPRVTTRNHSDMENCAREKTSFMSFKLWKANKQNEDETEDSREVESNGEKQGPSDAVISEAQKDDHGGVDSEGTAKTTGADAVQLNNSTGEMEDLQIALLECATEYEIKTIEMKMKLKNIKTLKGKPLPLDPQSTASDMSDLIAGPKKFTEEMIVDDMQSVEKVRRQVYKLQRQKGCLSKELADLKKKERQFELQKKSLDAALLKLDRLQWELVKKEQEVEDWQLRQRQVESQLVDSAVELQKLNETGELADLPMDTSSLLSLLPTLRDFIQTLAQKVSAGGYYDDTQFIQNEALCNPIQVDAIVSNLMHEIQSLKHELNEMACEDFKLTDPGGKNLRVPIFLRRVLSKQNNLTSKDHSGHNRPKHRPYPQLPRDRHPYGKF